jgi:hypothetical protein
VGNVKVSELTSATPAAADLLPFVDVSDTSMAPSGSTRKATVGDLLAALAVLSEVAIPDPTGLGWLAYLRADDVPGADGAAVASVTPSAGSVGAFTGTATLKRGVNGINGRNVLRFNGSTDKLASASGGGSLAGDWYFAAVVRFSSAVGVQTVLAAGNELDGQRRELVKLDSPATIAFNGYNHDVSSTTTAGTGTAYLLEIVRSGTTVSVYVNGALSGTGSPSLTAFSSAALRVGSNNGGGELFNGDLAECGFLASAPTAAKLFSYRLYLASRYGITTGAAFAVGSILAADGSGGAQASGLVDDGSTLTAAARKLAAAVAGGLEHTLQTQGLPAVGGNVLRLQQLSSTGYSVVYGIGHDVPANTEGYGAAFGWGNAGAVAPYAGSAFMEIYNLLSGSYKPGGVIQTSIGGVHRRIWLDAAGNVLIYRRAATYPNEGLALTIDSNGNIVPGAGAIATNATDGFLYLPTCAGTPTGTPTAYTGRAAAVYDTSAHKLWVYDGAAWRGVVLA